MSATAAGSVAECAVPPAGSSCFARVVCCLELAVRLVVASLAAIGRQNTSSCWGCRWRSWIGILRLPVLALELQVSAIAKQDRSAFVLAD